MMPRLFWKLFFALWLSIMAFAVLVSWINQSVLWQQGLEMQAEGFGESPRRFGSRLIPDLKQGDETQMARTLRALPHRLRNHVFVIGPDGRELLGRDVALERQRHGPARFHRQKFTAANGRSYTLVVIPRMPPRALLEPGPRGIGLRLGVAALVAALVSFLLARYLAAPLGQLSVAGRRLATGDLSARVGAPLGRRRDEFGQLALDLDEMAQRLQTAQQANQRLLRDVSHELRSPLARLRVALEIGRNKDSGAVAAELDRIELECGRLETLVDEVLGLLRESGDSQALRVEKFDLAEMLQDLVATVNYEIPEGRDQVRLATAPALPFKGDRELLWRAFENLLRNALQYSGGHGPVQVSAALTAGNRIRVDVEDCGPGIPEAHLSRVFEPFYRVDQARARTGGSGSGGHGLGLAIAASGVRRNGGRITAANRKRGGLRMQVTLPADSGASGA
ncbi:MAG: HAMP domain-containing sensor histidine kinase [Lysobacterales bacterium]